MMAMIATSHETLKDMPQIASRVIDYVLDNFAEEICLEDLAREAGLSRFNFCRKFQKECGVTPMRWLWTFRTLLAGEFLRLDARWSLTDVAFACGFTSSAHFSRSFKQVFGVTPTEFRRQASDETCDVQGDTHEMIFGGARSIAGKAALRAFG